jgi:hypothetical protein
MVWLNLIIGKTSGNFSIFLITEPCSSRLQRENDGILEKWNIEN